MGTIFTSKRRSLLAAAMLACVITPAATAAEINGVKFPETTTVAGRELQLNGYGMRTKLFIKLYAAGLYLPEKSSDVPTILKQEGPRRVMLVIMRDISSEDFGTAYMQGLDNNLTPGEKARLAPHIGQVGDMFGRLQGLKKGQVLNLDYVPGVGTTYEINGKKVIAPIPDLEYFNAMLRIWLGQKPVDAKLKTRLLAAGQ